MEASSAPRERPIARAAVWTRAVASPLIVPLSWVSVLGAAEHRYVVCSIGEGAPHLAAIDDPLVAIAPRPAAHVRKVGTGLGFRKGDGAQELAAGNPGQVLLALFLGSPT